MAKSPQMEAFLESLSKDLFGVSRKESFEKGICVSCGRPVNFGAFKTALNSREYEISGFCQECQDSTFREDEDDG